MSLKTTTTETIPVKYEFMGSLRRSNIDVPPKFSQLRKKLAKSFPQHADLFMTQDLRLIYTDDEGDEITITTTDELVTAYRLAQAEGKVLRFSVPDFTDADKASVKPNAQKPTKAQPEPWTRPRRPSFTSGSRQATDEPKQPEKPKPIPKLVRAVHGGITCDVTKQCPIVGPRFHKRGENYDLCEKAFNQLSPAQQAKFIRLDVPTRVFDWGHRVKHWGFTCDGSNMSPIVGPRYHRIGTDYDLCQAEFNKLPLAEKSAFVRVDVPGQPGQPVVPLRQRQQQRKQQAREQRKLVREQRKQLRAQKREAWQALQREKQAQEPSFSKDLTVEDDSQVLPGPIFKQWLMVAGAEGVPAGTKIVELSKNHKLAGTQQSFNVNGGEAVEPFAEFKVYASLNLKPAKPGRKLRSVWRLQAPNSRLIGPKIWVQIVVGSAPQTQTQKDHHDMTFVADVTIPDGQEVPALEEIRKTWLVRSNTGWGEGNSLRCLDEDGPYQGMAESVPAFPAGAEADLSITLTAPAASVDGTPFRSYWGLVDSDGNRFGDQLWVEIVPVSSTKAAVDEAAALEEVLETAAAEFIADVEKAEAEKTAAGGGDKDGSKNEESKNEETSATTAEVQIEETLQEVLKAFTGAEEVPPELAHVGAIAAKMVSNVNPETLKAVLGFAQHFMQQK